METYNTFKEFLNDVSRTERVTGHDQGTIIDTITRQLLGRWKFNANSQVVVEWN